MLKRSFLIFLLAFGSPAAAAAVLDLPVRLPGDDGSTPGYAAEVIELQLRPEAARVAHARSAGPTRAIATSRLGVPRVDALATSLGATFEPEFAGETPPEGASTGIDFTAFHLVHLPAGVDLVDALERFRALPEVASASPIAVLPVAWFPNDSLFGSQYALYRASSPRHDIHAPEAWSVEDGDTSIVIAILDTGVLAGHPDLSGTAPGQRGNLWTNWPEANGTPGVDDDGNGFADDVWGWDFVTGGCAGGVCGATGEDSDDADNDPNDFAGHGTLVAGIAGALTDNVSGIAGVSPKVRLMAVRMGWLPLGASRPSGTVRMDFAAQAIRYATRSGAHVINCSFASAFTAGLDSALTAASQAGVVVVAASGNFSQSNYLSTRPDVIAVGATDQDDVYWAGTQTGPWLDLVAGGVAVPSTYVQTATPDSVGYRQPSYHASVTGTSLASPVVAGVAAVMQAHMLAIGEEPLIPSSMRTWLRQTGDDVAAQNPGQPYLVPRVNLYRALTDSGLLDVAHGPRPAPPGLSLTARARPARAPIVLEWTADAALAGTPLALSLHDLSGRRVRSVALSGARTGRWTWDGRDGANALLPAGMYFARLAGGSHHAEARVVLLR